MSTPTTSRTSGASANASVPAPVPTSSARSSPRGATNERSCSRTVSTCWSACAATRSAVAPKRARTSSAFVRSGIDHRPPGPYWAAVDATDDLVVDRARHVRVRLGEDAVPKQHNRRADRELARKPDCERIHRDRPDDRAQLAGDAHLRSREVAREAVAVADGDEPDPGRLVGDEPPPVAGALAGLELFHLREKALPRQHRLEPVVGRVGVAGREPVDRATAPHRVEARLRQAQRRGAVRSVSRQLRVLVRERAEPLELCARELEVAVGSREVRHQPDDLGGRSRQLRQSVTPHPRVELQVDAHAFRDFVVRDRELEACLARVCNLAARARRAEHDDPLDAELVPQRETFGDRRDADRRRTGTERRAGGVDHPVPVAVRLHDGPELGTAGRTQESAHVAAQRAEVDRELRAVHYGRACGNAATTSDAITPRGWGTSCAARPCANAPAAAASRGSRPFARNAATIPVSTSPLPAVASAGVPDAEMSTPSPGAPTSVSAPFSTTTQPNRSTAA